MAFKSLARWFGFVPASEIKPLTCPAPPRPLSPHEQWPEILHWQEGDEVKSDTSNSHNYFHFYLLSITEGGMVYGKEWSTDHKLRQPLWMVMRDGSNLSLRDREIDEQLKTTNEYMVLLKEFNVAFAELQERDRKILRIAS